MHINIDGACLCGYIRYEAKINPDRVLICHCTQCQQHSASAFRTGVLVGRKNFRLISGEPKVYVKTAESGTPRALAFCPECGTSIYGSTVEDPQVFSLRIGTARQRAELVPKAHIWARSAMPWLSGLADMPRHDTMPDAPDAVPPDDACQPPGLAQDLAGPRHQA